jgi:hypothetical protein
MIKNLRLDEVIKIFGGINCWCPVVQDYYKQYPYIIIKADHVGVNQITIREGKTKKVYTFSIAWLGQTNREECKNVCCNEAGTPGWVWGSGQYGDCSY